MASKTKEIASRGEEALAIDSGISQVRKKAQPKRSKKDAERIETNNSADEESEDDSCTSEQSKVLFKAPRMRFAGSKKGISVQSAAAGSNKRSGSSTTSKLNLFSDFMSSAATSNLFIPNLKKK